MVRSTGRRDVLDKGNVGVERKFDTGFFRRFFRYVGRLCCVMKGLELEMRSGPDEKCYKKRLLRRSALEGAIGLTGRGWR